jgi:hypothetical protein
VTLETRLQEVACTVLSLSDKETVERGRANKNRVWGGVCAWLLRTDDKRMLPRTSHFTRYQNCDPMWSDS